ncbi:MAG: glycosyltransferase family 2 protein [Formosimonas sp.]
MTERSFKPIVIIPVYNHGETIGATVANILSNTDLPIILINDGSHAQCSQVLRTLTQHATRISLVAHEHNQGKGAAIQTGFYAAQQAGYTHALQVDADGQHQLSDIQHFITLAAQHPNALICGCPIYDESVPKKRLYARYLTHIWVWINTLSLRIKDSMCGFRIYPLTQIIPLLNRHHTFKRMSFETEILVYADWAGVSIINTPTQVKYPKNGVSHFLAVKDNVYISLAHSKLFLGMLVRFPRLIYRLWTDKPKNAT